jgi:hypothetical protein
VETVSPDASHSILAGNMDNGFFHALQAMEGRVSMASGRFYAILGG